MQKMLLLTFVLLNIFSCTDIDLANSTSSTDKSEYEKLTDPNQFIGQYKTKAMILGVFHFANPGLDAYKEKYEVNIFSDKRQKELNGLIERIAKYKPTKILLEANRIGSDSIFNARYRQYLNGEFDISERSNEHYQIGFKLAKRLGHQRIYCSDVKNAKWFGADIDWDNYDSEAYLKSQGQYGKATRYNFEKIYELDDSLKMVETLTAHFLRTNSNADRLKDHQAYLTSIIEGAGDNYIAADGVARWYQRNLKIFANAYDLADFDEADRLLLIYGAGHVWQLRQLFIDSPDFDYVEVNDYLKN